MVLDCFFYGIFWKTGVNCNYIQKMVGWDVDASQSQEICHSEDSESILCSNLPGGIFK